MVAPVTLSPGAFERTRSLLAERPQTDANTARRPPGAPPRPRAAARGVMGSSSRRRAAEAQSRLATIVQSSHDAIVGKTLAEMRMAIEGGIRQFNLESEPEMRALSALASSMGATVPVAVRVNPDVDAKTHEKIATGKSENKFGIPIARAREVYAEAASLPGLQVVGVDVHIGSQLTDLDPYRAAYAKAAAMLEDVARTVHLSRQLGEPLPLEPPPDGAAWSVAALQSRMSELPDIQQGLFQLTRDVERLKARLARKDEVIAEVTEELVRTKKSVGEP